MRTKTEQLKSAPVAPPPAGIAILSSRTKAEIGRIRREGAGWTAHAPGADGVWRSLGSFADFAAALGAVPDPVVVPAAVPEKRAVTAAPAPAPARRRRARDAGAVEVRA